MMRRPAREQLRARVRLASLGRAGQLSEAITPLSPSEQVELEVTISRIEFEESRRRHPAVAVYHRAEQIAARSRFRVLHAPKPEPE
jgi:hypothetical protein